MERAALAYTLRYQAKMNTAQGSIDQLGFGPAGSETKALSCSNTLCWVVKLTKLNLEPPWPREGPWRSLALLGEPARKPTKPPNAPRGGERTPPTGEAPRGDPPAGGAGGQAAQGGPPPRQGRDHLARARRPRPQPRRRGATRRPDPGGERREERGERGEITN